ncbi:MAG TPA: hypothetical protein VHX37_12275 [Acidobacteriaceae bacterium]|jgi:hypothetical protein|nr:hypothetical protein [Acidobacteriaceae bacterium]
MAGNPAPKHTYDAQAFALQGDLQLPLRADIRPQAFVSLPSQGGYLSERARDYHLEGVVSFRSAYTQVAGNHDLKAGHGCTTLATAVLEDFNILDVVTAQRVVAQISVEHPPDGYVPIVTFLGTRFEDLRIAGHKVEIELNRDLFAEKPANDELYSKDRRFRECVAQQYDQIRRQSSLPAEIAERYNRLPSNPSPQESIECSLVQRAEGPYPGRTFGHVIDIPHFGKVYLATVRLIESEYRDDEGTHSQTLIRLTMIEAKMGCPGHGTVAGPVTITNGAGKGTG